MSDPYLIPECKVMRAGARAAFTIDFKAWLRSYWIAGRDYNDGDFVRSPTLPGFAYQAQSAGEAGATEPAWPRVINGTVQDGSIEWLAVQPGTNAVDAIASVAWSLVSTDATLVISAQSNTNEEATASFFSTAQGSTDRIQCIVTTVGGQIHPVQFDLEIA